MIPLVFRVVLVLIFIEITFAKTCDERLENLENLYHSLQLRLEDQTFANNGLGKTGHDAFEIKLEKENQDLKRRVASLEEALTGSNRQMYRLQARVSELERKTQEQEARLATVERNSSVFDMKAPTLDRKSKKLSKQVDKANETKETLPNIFENYPLNRDNLTQAKGKILKTQINLDMPDQEYSHMDDVQNVLIEKRLLSGLQTTQTPFPGGVAFSAYVSTYETDISKDHTIKFDRIVTNIGNHYNPNSGTFTAPEHGVYVFTWNLYCHRDGYIHSQIVVNSNAVAAMFTSGQGATNIRTTTGIAVVEVNQGDVVFVRTHPTATYIGNLYSEPKWRSSFNGWKQF